MTGEDPTTQAIAPHTRPRRSESLDNPVFSNMFGQFERPDTAVLGELMAAEPRIRYFAVPEQPSPELGDLMLRGVVEGVEGGAIPEFRAADTIDFVRGVLGQQIARDFPDRKFIVRGTITSINGPVRLEDGGVVLDTQDVVAQGEEMSRGWLQGTSFPVISADRPPAVDFMSMQAAMEAEEFSANAVDDGGGVAGASLFPTVLVYDPAQLVKRPNAFYEYEIPAGSSPVLAAYVIDRPVGLSLLS